MADTSNKIAARSHELLMESNSIEKGKRYDKKERALILERNDYERRVEEHENKILDIDDVLSGISNPECIRARKKQQSIEGLTKKIDDLKWRIAEINEKLSAIAPTASGEDEGLEI